jgi:hypothetical protein
MQQHCWSLECKYTGDEIKQAIDVCVRVSEPGTVLVSTTTVRNLRAFPATTQVFEDGVTCPVFAKNLALDSFAPMTLLAVIPSDLRDILPFCAPLRKDQARSEGDRFKPTLEHVNPDTSERSEDKITADIVARVIGASLAMVSASYVKNHVQMLASSWSVEKSSTTRQKLMIAKRVARYIQESSTAHCHDQGSIGLDSHGSEDQRSSFGVEVRRRSEDIGDPDETHSGSQQSSAITVD